LATGAAPALPFAIPAELSGRIFTVNDLDDYRGFHAALAGFGRSARVAIVGTGLVGCEFANDRVAGGHRVAMVAPEASLLARLLPAALGHALGDAFVEAGISLYRGHTIGALGLDGDDVGLRLDDGRVLHADLVLVATGLRPRIALAAAAGL